MDFGNKGPPADIKMTAGCFSGEAAGRTMDLSAGDVAVKHAIAFSSLNIRHSFEASPSTVSLAKELRICVITIVLGFTVASIVRSISAPRRNP